MQPEHEQFRCYENRKFSWRWIKGKNLFSCWFNSFFKQNTHFQEIMNNTQKEEIFSLLTDFLKICQEKVHINHWILVQSRLNILDNIPQDKTNLENNEIIANQCR